MLGGGLLLLLAAGCVAQHHHTPGNDKRDCVSGYDDSCNEEDADSSLLQSKLSASKLAVADRRSAVGVAFDAVAPSGAAANASSSLAGQNSVQALLSSLTGSSEGGAVATRLLIIPAFLIVLALCGLSQTLSKYAAEFVGTFVLVLTVFCCIMTGSGTWNALAIACVLMAMIYATGSVSGANLNPAVSLTLGLSGVLTWDVVIKYWVSQLLGGFVAAGCAAALFPAADLPVLAPAAGFTGVHAVIAELLYTFMLCFVVLNCAVSKRNNDPKDGNEFFALAIGFVIVAGGYAVGGISGAAFNPAVAAALDVHHWGISGWSAGYGMAEFAGAALASLLYSVVRPDETYPQEQFRRYLPTLPIKCVSEFLGTFFLVLTVCLNLITGSPAVALSAAAALMCMVYSLGDVSGAHFNPAVTAACVARGKCPVGEALAFVLTQLLAGVLAGLLSALFHAASTSHDTTFGVQPGEGYNFIQAAGAEFFATFVLAYTVLAVATTNPLPNQASKQKMYFALTIGFCVTAGGFGIGAVSGGELNPAVGFGISTLGLASPGKTAAASFMTMIGLSLMEVLGGLLAALVFFVTHPKERDAHAEEEVASMVCEFVGTFVLVFTVGCCVLTGSGTWNATAIASVLMAMIYAVGPVSGGHLNPAVSFSLGLSGNIKYAKVFKYWVAQLLGGSLAGAAVHALLAPKALSLEPGASYTAWHAVLAEFIYTAMLCFVVLNVAASRRNNPPHNGNQFFALAIGFVIVAGGYAAGGISGACFNPAVALGVDIKHFGFGWGIVWGLAELSGAVLAVALYRLVRPDEALSEADAQRYTALLPTKCASEFLGTFMLVLTVGLNVVMASPATAWSAAAALMSMIYALGSVSGAHFNPAVTLAIVASGRNKCSAKDAFAYTLTQMIAGVLAGLLCASFHAAGPNAAKTFALVPGAKYDACGAGLCEMFFTFVLGYVVLSVATTRDPPQQQSEHPFHFALAIASCVTAGGNAIGAASGGELNPAVAIGVAAQDLSFGFFLVFALWELAGGMLAAIAFRVTHRVEFSEPEKV